MPQNTTTYYHSDDLSSARLATNWYGYPTWSATYLPFGQEWNPESTVNHYKFTGQEHDSESGLDNFRARYDSTTFGRFMSPDPLLYGDISDPQTLNRYVYVRENPTNLVDPTGEFRHSARRGGFRVTLASRIFDIFSLFVRIGWRRWALT